MTGVLIKREHLDRDILWEECHVNMKMAIYKPRRGAGTDLPSQPSVEISPPTPWFLISSLEKFSSYVFFVVV